jgi:outer membrane protein
MKKFLLALTLAGALHAGQAPTLLTIADAEKMALANHPAIEGSRLESEAVRERVNQYRAAYQPVMGANFTAVGANDASRVAAGALNNPIIYSRLGSGVTVNQLITDFGRTGHLVESSRASADAAADRVNATRADVVLEARRAYLNALRADTVLTVAKATVNARQLVVDQISELVKANLKSSLDLSFAETALSEAKLLVSSAENDRRAARASLAQALGRRDLDSFELSDPGEPKLEPLALSDFQSDALRNRPDLQALRSDVAASQQFAAAEKALKYPTLAFTGTVGYVPAGASQVPSNFGAAGLNIALPFLNGGLNKSREAEATLRARALDRRVVDLENRISRDVTVAWLDVNTASERIGLTKQFVEQATQALELAQARYDLGLGSIVELSQAQLTRTSAEIQYTTAKYDYQIRRTLLDYRSGRL